MSNTQGCAKSTHILVAPAGRDHFACNLWTGGDVAACHSETLGGSHPSTFSTADCNPNRSEQGGTLAWVRKNILERADSVWTEAAVDSEILAKMVA